MHDMDRMSMTVDPGIEVSIGRGTGVDLRGLHIAQPTGCITSIIPTVVPIIVQMGMDMGMQSGGMTD